MDKELLEAFERLDDESISQEKFPGATDDVQTYLFNLNYAHKPILPFEWVDYPGGVLRHKDEHYDKIAKTIKESSTLFICVDGKLLVGNDTARKIRNVKRKCSMTINRYFGKYFEAGGKLPPVGIILTKADLFSHDIPVTFKYLIESNKGSINDWRSLKHDEEDSFFIWRDDDKIRRLAAQIFHTQKEN